MNSFYRTSFTLAALGTLCLATACSSQAPIRTPEAELSEAVPIAVDPVASTDSVPTTVPETILSADAPSPLADTPVAVSPATASPTDTLAPPVPSTSVAELPLPLADPSASAEPAGLAKADLTAGVVATADIKPAVSADQSKADQPKKRHKKVAKTSTPREPSVPAPVQERVVAEAAPAQPMTPPPSIPTMAQAQPSAVTPPPAPINPEPARMVSPPELIAPAQAASEQKAGVVDPSEEGTPLHKNPWVLGGAVVLLLAGGFVAFRPRSSGY